MLVEHKGNLVIEIFESYSEYSNNHLRSSADIFEIKADENSYQIEPNHWGSRLIGWQKNISGQFIDSIPRSHQKKIRKALNKTSKLGITSQIFGIGEIPTKYYGTWLCEIYRPFMKTKGKLPYIDEDWLNTESASTHGALFLFEEHKMISGSFFKKTKTGDVSFSYKAVNHELAFDPNPLIEETSYEIAKTYCAKKIRKGIDYNLYGADLSLGLMEYKLKFGFTPVSYISSKGMFPSYYRHILRNNNGKFKNRMVTFTLNNKLQIEMQAQELDTPMSLFLN